MASKLIPTRRVQTLNDREPDGDGRYVLYWMQASQRAEFNHALEHAVQRANGLGKPLLVGFGLTERYPESNLRHKTFLLQGLQDVESALGRRDIRLVVRLGEPDDVALGLGRDAALIVTDRGYLRHQKRWRERVAAEAGVAVVQVETDVCVPVDVVSDKQEHAARTIRPKVHRHLDDFLVDLRTTPVDRGSLDLDVAGEPLDDLDALLDRMDLDRSVPASPLFTGGAAAARRVFRGFLGSKFDHYARHRNQPQTGDVSHMSMYLHLGHVSPVWLVLEAKQAKRHGENVDDFVEELVVRRELAINFVNFCDGYDRYEDAVPAFARKTLADHAGDEREHVYTRDELEAAETHDPYWNAAMREMRETGYMHNYMRMYWGKKVLEWTESPEAAFETALAINNKYFLDGRDPNSFTGVAWCFGLHDRGWAEREVFGKVRYMNANGLRRKCDIEGYVEKVEALVDEVARSQ